MGGMGGMHGGGHHGMKHFQKHGKKMRKHAFKDGHSAWRKHYKHKDHKRHKKHMKHGGYHHMGGYEKGHYKKNKKMKKGMAHGIMSHKMEQHGGGHLIDGGLGTGHGVVNAEFAGGAGGGTAMNALVGNMAATDTMLHAGHHAGFGMH